MGAVLLFCAICCATNLTSCAKKDIIVIMLKVSEFIEMPVIERVRTEALGRGLDEHDNFSWHAALFQNETEVLGVCRFYRKGEDLFVDDPALLTDDAFCREMLFRTVLLKASGVECRYVLANGERAYLEKFGFCDHGGVFGAVPSEIRFPHDCCGHK